MIISDLNHLETIAEDPKVVGGYGYYQPYFPFGFNKFINVGIDIEENVATIDGRAQAFGEKTFTNVTGSTTTTEHGSQSTLSTISVSSSKNKKHYY
ncbi:MULTISPECIES: hypothetical protein [Moorena]|uniref:Uncharacterized protein n=1 Tax=Moorena producens 3L TaxID=489825 RepID=F4Y344_9CYAN|nr:MULTISPECIES: hypothetical protein [Moorena]NEQ18121.1 hypothetical protein [Moorena sp. SIO3E2]EGJ28520.1 hypothetical protein LYNGBM3L_71700 [Moorena producens 3L]NEP32168.1 hypothetical protein [Moorena sp. SIO3B2]NEP67279.1 hypothetical protein [Moorena sp. SIO3A5]NEQ05595.1 hypothetical protein [Moorena sp. SIO4E2]